MDETPTDKHVKLSVEDDCRDKSYRSIEMKRVTVEWRQ